MSRLTWPRPVLWLLGASILLCMVLAAAGLYFAWPDIAHTEVIETQLPQPASPALLKRGEYLARAGNCIGCHTVRGGSAYSGGRRVRTPFGSLFTSNLTPDAETGLGNWSTGDFWRAMHHGKSKDGRLLYPAFPYNNYTRVTRADSDAIYAYLRSLDPVSQPRRPNQLDFPYNTQAALLVWRTLFFEAAETFEPDPAKSKNWNRGAYLVEGLGHCNACHTPRGAWGQTLVAHDYEGGTIPEQRWSALPLKQNHQLSDAEAAELVRLLKSGTSAQNVTTGPMAEVVFNSLQYLTHDDVNAMVEYLRSLPLAPVSDSSRALRGTRVSSSQRNKLMKQGVDVYEEHCAECHADNGLGEPYIYPALAGNSLVTATAPGNAIISVMSGGFAPGTKDNPRPYGMPPFAQTLSAEEIAAVLTYIRNAWGNNAPAVAPVDITRH